MQREKICTNTDTSTHIHTDNSTMEEEAYILKKRKVKINKRETVRRT